MYLSKRKAILVISISILVFFFTYTDIKSQDIKITDGDTIKVNGEKIRFSGIDTPELKQTCIKQGVKKPIYSLYLSILRLTAFPFLSLLYVIYIRGGDYNDIFYTIMATNWFMGIALIIFIGYFLNNVFKQKKSHFSY